VTPLRYLRATVQSAVKRSLLRLGARSSEMTLHRLNGMLDYVELGRWLRIHGFSGGARTDSCTEVFSLIADAVEAREVLYLQFGAHDPGITKKWAELLRHPGTRFEIFDSEDSYYDTWLPARGRGHVWEAPVRRDADARSEALQSLQARDPRVRYVLGERLEDLLDAYAWPEPEALVAVFDTDYYTTTKIALSFVGRRLPLGSYIFLDQLNHRADEMRAFHEFLLKSELKFELIAANRLLSCAAFRRVG
jgi:hypothetical protein